MEDLVNLLVDLGQSLKNSGLTSGWLLLIAGLFLITLVAAFRELSSWYFKVNQIQSQLNDLKDAIERLEKRLPYQDTAKKGLDSLSQNHKVSLASGDTQSRFTLNH